jgi:hypothetical protein
MRTILFLGFFLIVFLGLKKDCNAQIQCPVAYFELNGNAIDSGGHQYDGVLIGTSPAIDRFGQPNNAIHFNGISDNILLPSLFDFQERSINFWFNAENVGYSKQFIYSSDCSSQQFGRTSISVIKIGSPKIIFDAGGSQFTFPFNEGEWYMATISVDTDSTKFYLNGNLISTQITNILHSSYGINQTVLGSNSNANGNFFEGIIDQLNITLCPFVPDTSNGISTFEKKEIASFSIFPNPVNDFININSNIEIKNITIFNLEGRKIFAKNISGTTETIDTKDLGEGVYFATIQFLDNNTATKKIVIIRNN